MAKNKRGMSAGVWLIILLVLLSIGVTIFFWLSGDESSATNIIKNIGNSVPQPPALPS